MEADLDPERRGVIQRDPQRRGRRRPAERDRALLFRRVPALAEQPLVIIADIEAPIGSQRIRQEAIRRQQVVVAG